MFRLMQNGVMVALGDDPRYIRKQANGSYGFCTREEAQGVAVDSKPYHIDGMDALDGAETASMEQVASEAVVSDLAAAGAVYSAQADAGNITPAEMSLHPDLFPRLKGDGSLVKAGKHINWGGMVKRAAIDLWDTEANDPNHTPGLWEDIAYREGYRIIPETITAGTAFAKDECGWWEDTLYKSLIDANVYTPEQYPAGWEVV